MAIEIKNLTFAFKDGFFASNDGFKALENVNCTIPSAKAVNILGPHECGKSTLLDVILGKKMAQGVYLNGKDISSLNEYDRPFAYYGQFDLYGEENKKGTLEDFLYCDNYDVAKGKRKHGRPAFGPKEVEIISQQMEIEAYMQRHPRQMSSGQKMRAEMARAILWKCEAYIYNPERGKGISPLLWPSVIETIVPFLKQNGLIFLWAYEERMLYAHMGDYLIAMKYGRVLVEGPSDVLCSCPTHYLLATWIWGMGNDILDREMFRIEGGKKLLPDDRLMVSPYGISFVDEGEHGIKAKLISKYCRGAYTFCYIEIKEERFGFFHYGPCPFEAGADVEIDIDPDEVYISHQDDEGTIEPIFDR